MNEQNNTLMINKLLDYYMTYRPLEQETGDYLRKTAPYNPKMYSNDLRHQYASAVFAQKFGQNQAKILGDLNEVTDFNGSGRQDSQIDKFNNKIGREYALNYPNYTKQQYLDKMFEDFYLNKKKRLNELGY